MDPANWLMILNQKCFVAYFAAKPIAENPRHMPRYGGLFEAKTLRLEFLLEGQIFTWTDGRIVRATSSTRRSYVVKPRLKTRTDSPVLGCEYRFGSHGTRFIPGRNAN